MDLCPWPRDDATFWQDLSTPFYIVIEFNATEYSYSIHFILKNLRIFHSIWVKFHIRPILPTPTPHTPLPPSPSPSPNYWDKDKHENDLSQHKQLVAPPTGPALRFKNGFPFLSQRMLSVERPVAGHLKLTLPLTAQSFDRTGRFVCQAGAGDNNKTYMSRHVYSPTRIYTNMPQLYAG